MFTARVIVSPTITELDWLLDPRAINIWPHGATLGGAHSALITRTHTRLQFAIRLLRVTILTS